MDSELLLSKSLHQLKPADLSDYAFNAMMTFGDENDFKHFLPRIFEIIVSELKDFHVDIEVVSIVEVKFYNEFVFGLKQYFLA